MWSMMPGMGAGWIGRWWRTIMFGLIAVAVALVVVWDGNLLVGIGLGAVLVGVAAYLTPRDPPHTLSHEEAQLRARRDGALIVYWRPGAARGERLRSELRGESGIVWVDIWQDTAAAAFVRELNDGVEVVPTVIAGSAVWPSPGTEKVRAALRAVPAG